MRNEVLEVVSKIAVPPNHVFSRSEVARHGVDHRQIALLKRYAVVAEPWRGSLILCRPGSPPEWAQLMAAALLGREAVASHRAAARLHRLEGFLDEPALELSCAHEVNVRLTGVSCHRVTDLGRADIVTIDGMRCTNLARTLVDLGSVVEPLRLERAFDDALRRGIHPRWLRETARRLVRPKVAGPNALLALLDAHQRRGVVRGSWFEKLVELCLDDVELSGVVAQYELRDDTGAHVATFDLAVPDAKLGIEAHSKRHHFGAEAEASDDRRDHAASLLGWDVMYLGYASVRSPSTVCRDVRDRVRNRRSMLGTSYATPPQEVV